jgi:hypothetical protein
MTIQIETTYISSTIPAKTVYVSGLTLFHVAEIYLGDAMRWVELAQINNLTDPWLRGVTQVLLPPVLSSAPLSGILGE